MDEEAHAFAVELARREVQNCRDLETLRGLTLQVIDLLEGQRRWLNQAVQRGWLRDSEAA